MEKACQKNDAQANQTERGKAEEPTVFMSLWLYFYEGFRPMAET
jgi:hypothetical protein